MTVNKDVIKRSMTKGHLLATDLADYLVKNHSMTFRNAYKKTASIVNFADLKKKKLNEYFIMRERNRNLAMKDRKFMQTRWPCVSYFLFLDTLIYFNIQIKKL